MTANQTPSVEEMIAWMNRLEEGCTVWEGEMSVIQAIRDRLSALTPGEDAEAKSLAVGLAAYAYKFPKTYGECFMSNHGPYDGKLADLIARQIQAYGDARAAAEIPDGWQLVPKEPTVEMLDAAMGNLMRDPVVIAGCYEESREDWKVMLAAAPQPEKVTK